MIDIKSEQDYLVATKKLADEFLKEYTHEKLAEIAAQHVIFREFIEARNKELEQTNKELWQRSARAELKYDELMRIQASIAALAVKSYSSYRGKLGGDALSAANSQNRINAVAEWDAREKEFSSREGFANAVCKKYNSKPSTIMTWLREDRPAVSNSKKNDKPQQRIERGLGFHPAKSPSKTR